MDPAVGKFQGKYLTLQIQKKGKPVQEGLDSFHIPVRSQKEQPGLQYIAPAMLQIRQKKE